MEVNTTIYNTAHNYAHTQHNYTQNNTTIYIHNTTHNLNNLFFSFHLPLYFFDLKMCADTSFQSLFLILNFNIVNVILFSAVRMTRAVATTDSRLPTLSSTVTESPPIPPKSQLPSRKSMDQSVHDTDIYVRNSGTHVHHIRPFMGSWRRNYFASETESLDF